MIFAYFIVFQNIHIVEQSLYNNKNIKQLFGHSHNVLSTSMGTCILKAHHNLRIALICNKMENGKKTILSEKFKNKISKHTISPTSFGVYCLDCSYVLRHTRPALFCIMLKT